MGSARPFCTCCSRAVLRRRSSEFQLNSLHGECNLQKADISFEYFCIVSLQHHSRVQSTPARILLFLVLAALHWRRRKEVRRYFDCWDLLHLMRQLQQQQHSPWASECSSRPYRLSRVSLDPGIEALGQSLELELVLEMIGRQLQQGPRLGLSRLSHSPPPPPPPPPPHSLRPPPICW